MKKQHNKTATVNEKEKKKMKWERNPSNGRHVASKVANCCFFILSINCRGMQMELFACSHVESVESECKKFSEFKGRTFLP